VSLPPGRDVVSVLLLLFALACADTTEPDPPVMVGVVEVTGSPSTLQVGQTVQLSATVRSTTDSVLTDRTVSWSSNASAMATVSTTGLVTAVSPGTVVISAATGGVSGDFTVTVIPVPVGVVEVTPPAATILVGASQGLTAVTKSAAGAPLPGRSVSWSSLAPAVATVNGSGLVTGVSQGVAEVTATSEGVSDTATVTVQPVPVASLTLTPASETVVVGGEATLTATTRDAANNLLTGRVIAWGSLDPAVATVAGNGTVTGVGLGTTGIVATSEEKADTATILVTMASGSWASAQEMSTPRWHFGFGVVNGVAVAAGGYNPTFGHRRTVETLPLPSGTWTTRADRPTVQTGAASGVIGSQLYMAGGTNAAAVIAETWSYAPADDAWVPRAAMPGGVRADAAGAVINGILHVAGGRDASGTLMARLEAFDPSTDSAGTWMARAAMPTPRREAAAAALGGLMYVAGGVVTGDTVTGVLEAYDPATNTWASLAPMPTPRRDLVLTAHNGVLYAVGGNNGIHSAAVEAYVPSLNAWYSLAPMPTARTGARGGAFNGKIYVLGGYSGTSFALVVLQVFTP
jgi:uncharacterized protein YjdB